ncbi:MAG: hypothetical protein CBB68_02945 [Rhodospirillaceae bacterium TMED8]|nr:disulfide bond formation protein DsbA [Magnetovibrio sp.]OUT52326.1 MAG: hypothetical protein CBB68_02945 [Rhodospirillaceae bacterium TMED8]|tara:strand:- start:348 stop:992 length:645 start_codon:yes stop_codon:yes gene_type:complete
MLNQRVFYGFRLIFFIAVILSPEAIKTSHAKAGLVSLQESMQKAMVGDPTATVIITEYASLGCTHCAHFHQKTFPHLKRDYIDTGKVKMVFVDFPLGTPALAASMIARCAGPKRYFGFVDLFFRSQKSWAQAENPLTALKKVARFGGLNSDDVDHCIQQQPLIDYIQNTARDASEEHDINSTPSFVINGQKHSGFIEYGAFKSLVDNALHRANQ